MFDEQIRKVYTYMKQFTPEERVKLARMTALWINDNLLNPSVLSAIAVVSSVLTKLFQCKLLFNSKPEVYIENVVLLFL